MIDEQQQEFETWWQENVGNDDFCYLDKGDALECWQAATLAERERCAKIAESYDDGGENHQCNNACTDIAQAIRAGETI